MEAREAMKKRKCVKKYLDKHVSNELLFELLDCARWAQTAMGSQSWEFVIVRDPNKKIKLAEAADQEWVSKAPLIVVVASNIERIEFNLKRKAWDYAVMEVSASIQNFQIAARSLGLGTCAVFMFDREKVRELIQSPEKVIPLAMVPVGYPREFPENSREPLSQFVHDEEFGIPIEVPKEFDKKWRRNSIFHIFK